MYRYLTKKKYVEKNIYEYLTLRRDSGEVVSKRFCFIIRRNGYSISKYFKTFQEAKDYKTLIEQTERTCANIIQGSNFASAAQNIQSDKLYQNQN